MYFIDKIEENSRRYPDRAALALDFGQDSVSYSELWDQSGRIYAALKDAGIGPEDIVMLLLPRHPRMLVALLGVLRSGAAAMLVEDSYPAERVDYMKDDAGVRLILDEDFYEKALNGPSLPGRERLRLHDACFVFYTSGTTGKPKGILHEYGILDMGISGSVPDESAVDFDDCGRFTFVPPFNFSATMIHGLPELYKANTLYILSYDVSKNFKKLHELLEKEKITELFLSPSVLRIYKEGFPFVRAIMTGSEPASNLSVPGYEVIVHYAMTESLYCVSRYRLRDPCSDAPIASKETGADIRILGEDGAPVQDGETGEICFPNPYFRGYINMPEKTGEALRGGLFHSGDLGYRSENGDVFLLGRSDDMIKINGNRIEPGEIEGAAREISGLKNVIAKGFCEEGRSYVALYYLSSEAGENCIFRDAAMSRRALAEKLPSYMTPSYFVPIDSLPLNPNGKVSRKLLPSPEAAVSYGIGRKPENQAEAFFCSVMAEVLSRENIGVEDDFYEAGGDSLSAIRLITACADKGFDITVSQLLEVRTAAGLARLTAGRAGLSREERLKKENEARQRPYGLLSGQKLYWNLFEKYPEHPSICVPVIAVLKKDTDLERLRTAADRVITHHPALLSRFRIDENGKPVQYYDFAAFTPVVIEDMTDEELKAESRNFLHSVNLLSDRAVTVRIIRSPEKNLFLLSVHHIMGDGMTNTMLLKQIAACYADLEAELPPDCYYTVCAVETGEETDALRAEADTAFRERLSALGPGSAVLRPDLPGPDSGSATFFLPDVLPKSGNYSNRIFVTACLMAMAGANGCDDALIYTAYSGRDSQLKSDSAGCHTILVPVSLTGIGSRSGKDLLSDVQAQLDFGNSHGVYSAITESGLPLDETVIFNYQSGTMDFGAFQDLAVFVSMLQRDRNQPNCLFNTGILDREDSDSFGFYCNFPKGMYSQQTVAAFGRRFLDAVHALTDDESV